MRTILASATAIAAALPHAAALAQDDDATDTIVVVGENVYRDRTADINPTLSYDLDFFQRFEPATVGEMLKRTPGVVFSGDVLEYDAVQLRGLGHEYTEVLINGRRAPGQGGDGTFFVDRIPAELIERIEIIRSPSANITSEGVAGVLNVILKDGADVEGAIARAGLTYYGDGDEALRGSLAAAISQSGPGYDYWLGFNAQQRRNPKEKLEEYFDDAGDLEGFAFEDDTRDGDDYSFNGSLGLEAGGGELRFNGFYVFTDRQEREVVQEFEGDYASNELAVIATQLENIEQSSYGAEGVFTRSALGGKIELGLGFAGYDEDTTEFETEQEFAGGVGGPIEEDDGEIVIEDQIYYANASYRLDLDESYSVQIGADARLSDRSGVQDSRNALTDVEADIELTQYAPFIVATYEPVDSFSLEGGLRYDFYEREVGFEGAMNELSDEEILPSLHARWDVTANDRIRASAARTLRRPELELVTPFEEDETPGDDDAVVGNPALRSESAWGFDIGYERAFGRRGVIGLNYFYRDVSDLIEITDTGEPYEGGPGAIFTPMNVGDGVASGVELDISTPLDFIGLPETGFYANYAYLDSEVTDPFTGADRPFRDQPEYVYNVSLSQNFPDFDAAAGVSYQRRGDSLATEFDEYVVLSYEPNLEAFLEKSINDSIVVRLTGTNLLDARKDEFIRDFGDIINEVQYEQSSPTYTVTLRAAF